MHPRRAITRAASIGCLAVLFAVGAARRSASEEFWKKVDTPESLGWSSSRLAAVTEHTRRLGTAVLMIVTEGRVVHAQGDLGKAFLANSIRKSFMSALLGIYIEEGKIDPSKTLAALGIDDKQPLTRVEKTATVMDLLKARSGVYHPAASEIEAMRQERPRRGSHTPGTHWYYNNWDFNALGTIFEQETGVGVFEAFKHRIADPIGMEDFDPSRNRYKTEDSSIYRSYRFRISARDLARFGQLYLNGGSWQDRQVVPAKWVGQSTAAYSVTGDPGTKSGYGLMWWVATNDGEYKELGIRNGMYTASGHCGQRLTVMPQTKTVVVHLVDTEREVDGKKPCIGSSKYDKLLTEILKARTE